MKFSIFSAVLFSIGWMSFVAAGNGPPPTCCHTVSNTRIPAENIVKYEMQESTALCALRAVRFYTKRDKAICSDPDSKYAKRVMDIVDGRTTAKPAMCYTSTTNMIPAVTTTNKTPRTQTETSTSTNASRIVTRIETSRPDTETSTSTTASQIVTTTETSRQETVITKTTNQITPVFKENSESSMSTATTCGTGGSTLPSTETKPEIPGIGTVTHLTTLKTKDNTETTLPTTTKPETTLRTTTKPETTLPTMTKPETTLRTTTKPSKLKIKILRKKSKKNLRKFQMNKHPKDKSG